MDSEKNKHQGASSLPSRVVGKKGMNYMGQYYGSPELAAHVGEMAQVSFDAAMVCPEFLLCSIGDKQIILKPSGYIINVKTVREQFRLFVS